MRYRRLGRTNLQVSEISLGAARGVEDPPGFIATVHAAIDAGINFIDTAAMYGRGESERLLGEALRGHDDVLVETKYCPYEGGQDLADAETLIASAETSLRRLRRDRLDVFLGHAIHGATSLDRFLYGGCAEAMLRLREQGKVRFIGISELSEEDGMHATLLRALPTGLFDVAMVALNLLLQTAAGTVLPLCRRLDVGTVVMTPLNQPAGGAGLISVPAALESVRRCIAHGDLPDAPPYADPGLFDVLAPLPLPAAALHYVLAHDVGTCCIGARAPARVRENCAVPASPGLSPAQLDCLRALFGGIRTQLH